MRRSRSLCRALYLGSLAISIVVMVLWLVTGSAPERPDSTESKPYLHPSVTPQLYWYERA